MLWLLVGYLSSLQQASLAADEPHAPRPAGKGWILPKGTYRATEGGRKLPTKGDGISPQAVLREESALCMKLTPGKTYKNVLEKKDEYKILHNGPRTFSLGYPKTKGEAFNLEVNESLLHHSVQ